ncbi:hypothetical protein D3C78_1631610 [compost metagenome]
MDSRFMSWGDRLGTRSSTGSSAGAISFFEGIPEYPTNLSPSPRNRNISVMFTSWVMARCGTAV